MEEIKETKRDFENFHHKCVGWYITILGFFIAGMIAVGQSDQTNPKIVGWSIIVCSATISLLFFLCIFHYSARIAKLGRFLSKKEEPPENWYEECTKCGISIDGIGSWFFFSIIIVMQAIVFWLAYLKYSIC